MNILPSILLLASVFLQKGVQAQPSAFECGIPELADEIGIDKTFDTIVPGDSDRKCSLNGKFITAKKVHWHIYAIPADETPKISMNPPGLVQPSVSGDGKLRFSFRKSALRDLDIVKGDSVQAGVNLYIPASSFQRVLINGVDENVEIINNLNSTELESFQVRDSGVDNRLYVTSPNARVFYKGSGVDSVAIMESASGSSVDVSGVDNQVKIKTGNDLDVEMSGVDQWVWIEGDYTRIKMSGVDGDVRVNGPTGCNDFFIDKSGTGNNCKLTDETVTVNNLECVADTKAGKYSCGEWWDLTTGQSIGVGIAVLVAFGLIVGLCIYGCIRCCRGGRSRDNFHGDYPRSTNAAGVVYPTTTSVDKPVAPVAVAFRTPGPIAYSSKQGASVDQMIRAEIVSEASSSNPTATTDKDELYQVETGVGYAS